MQKLDAPALANALNALAETFDRKAIPGKALEMWFDTLREFHTEPVLALLNSWPKIHGKMPVPAEVWKVLNERAVEDREQRHRAEKAQRAKNYANPGPTQGGKLQIDAIYDILLRTQKPTPLEHWRTVIDKTGLPEVSYEYARKALAILEPREKAAA